MIHFYYYADNTLHHMPNPVYFEIIRSYEYPADSLEVSFAIDSIFPEIADIRVRDGSREIFWGYVDTQVTSYSDKGYILTITARSRSALLLDNEALPQLYYSVRINDIYNKHIRPYQFFEIYYSFNPCLSVFSVRKGMSEWDVLDTFCRRAMGLSPYIEDGIVYARPLFGKRTHRFGRQNLDFSSIAVRINRHEVISKLCIRDRNGYYTSAVTNPNAMNVKRKQYIIPSSEFEDAPSLDAKERIKLSMRKKFSVRITVADILTANIGDDVIVNDSVFDFEHLVISELKYTLTPNGYLTTIEARKEEDA